MSQEKVDRYKKEKKNRKKNIKKQKLGNALRATLFTLIILALAGYIGWSVYRHYNPKKVEETTTGFQNAYTADELASILAEQTATQTENVTESESASEEESETNKKKKNKNKNTNDAETASELPSEEEVQSSEELE